MVYNWLNSKETKKGSQKQVKETKENKYRQNMQPIINIQPKVGGNAFKLTIYCTEKKPENKLSQPPTDIIASNMSRDCQLLNIQ